MLHYRTTTTHDYGCEIKHVQAIQQTEERSYSLVFDSSKLLPDTADGKKILECGLIMSINADTRKFVPYVADGSNGTDSDKPVAVLDSHYDMTYGDLGVSGVTDSVLYEVKCYILVNGKKQPITDDVKTALNKITFWKQGVL